MTKAHRFPEAAIALLSKANRKLQRICPLSVIRADAHKPRELIGRRRFEWFRYGNPVFRKLGATEFREFDLSHQDMLIQQIPICVIESDNW